MSYVSEGRKIWGDKRDARRIRGLDGLHCYFPYIMKKRTDAECYMHKELDVTELLRYINEKNESLRDANGELDPQKKSTLFHAIVYMCAKVVTERPALNRFIKARRYYQRDRISLSFVARKRFEDHSEEALMVFFPDGSERLSDFTERIVGRVHKARTDESYGIDDSLNLFAKIPRIFMLLLQVVIDLADTLCILPASLVRDDTNHTTILLSNLGSVGSDAVYHHLNNFGDNSIVMTIGVIRKAQKVMPDGTLAIRDVVNLGVTIDERIADGFYFARSLKLFDHIAEHPEMLEMPLSEPSDLKY